VAEEVAPTLVAEGVGQHSAPTLVVMAAEDQEEMAESAGLEASRYAEVVLMAVT
jgi:hypothetical protein